MLNFRKNSTNYLKISINIKKRKILKTNLINIKILYMNMTQINDKILNDILTEFKGLKKEIKKLERKVDLLSFTQKDVEIYKLVKDMEQENLWGNEEDLRRNGIRV